MEESYGGIGREGRREGGEEERRRGIVKRLFPVIQKQGHPEHLRVSEGLNLQQHV